MRIFFIYISFVYELNLCTYDTSYVPDLVTRNTKFQVCGTKEVVLHNVRRLIVSSLQSLGGDWSIGWEVNQTCPISKDILMSTSLVAVLTRS